jgi:ferritin-like metal-binding protein YciE
MLTIYVSPQYLLNVGPGDYYGANILRRLEIYKENYISKLKTGENVMNKTLKDLFVDEIKDLYNAEKQLIKAIPVMAKNATSQDLKEAFQKHLKETENQVTRLEQVFKELDMKPISKKCKAMEGIIEEGKEIIDEYSDSSAMDAALIAAAQKVEHYEIASYGTVRSYAEQLNLSKSASLLQETLEEESAANEKLNELAEDHINSDASDDSDDRMK